MEEQKIHEKREKKRKAELLVAAGLFLGFGIGFALGNPAAGILVGFGGGLAAYAVARLFEK